MDKTSNSKSCGEQVECNKCNYCAECIKAQTTEYILTDCKKNIINNINNIYRLTDNTNYKSTHYCFKLHKEIPDDNLL